MRILAIPLFCWAGSSAAQSINVNAVESRIQSGTQAAASIDAVDPPAVKKLRANAVLIGKSDQEGELTHETELRQEKVQTETDRAERRDSLADCERRVGAKY